MAVLFKLSKRYHINTTQAIAWNYASAVLLSWLIFRPQFPEISAAPMGIYVFLGLLLPFMFVVIAASIQYTGIVRTDVAQRLSLFIPIVAAYFLFREDFSTVKIAGILLGFIAIICAIPWQKDKTINTGRPQWAYLLTVFLGMGIIDVLFKQIAKQTDIPFTASLFIVFIIASGIAFATLIILIILKKMKFEWINVLCGLILGVFNFGNIFFYLKAHQALANTPSIVFSSMNIGVIILGSIVGILIFKEKLSRLNYIGIALAVVSIVIITMAH